MDLTSCESRDRLAHFIAMSAGARKVEIVDMAMLSGGAIQENVGLAVTIEGGVMTGTADLVLRTSPRHTVADSLTRGQEFAVLRQAFKAGVTVPEPLWWCADPTVIGQDFYIMRRVAGTAAGHVLVRGASRSALARRLGAELACLHRVVPPVADLEFLEYPAPSPALHAIAAYRGYLDRLPDPYPALEYGLRALELRAPPQDILVLCHRDFRTGNYMVEGDRVTGVLDWEFAGWGDPMEDIGWFCARCWRFGRLDREAGGIADRKSFYEGYEEESGRSVDPDRVAYWEAMAYARWALIALLQGQRHLSGAEPSLTLALTGRKVPEMEFDLLLAIDALEQSGRGT